MCNLTHKRLDHPALQFTGHLLRYKPSEDEEQEHHHAAEVRRRLGRLAQAVGWHELYLRSFWNGVLIEFIGSAVFCWMHVAIILGGIHYDYPNLTIGIFHGIMVAMFIYQFAAVSGAHFNALVSAATFLTGHTLFCRAVLYVLAQMLGFFVGAVCFMATIPSPLFVELRAGSCYQGAATSGQAVAIEFFASIMLLFVSYGTALNARQAQIFGPVLAPIFIGSIVALNVFSVGGIFPPPFAPGFNPSQCFGTAAALATQIGSDAWHNHW
ncbi:MAG: aquaporin, partial [archaeon]|nr:aquaporin [archaeon]